MGGVTRVGVSFPPELLKEFDEIISAMKYPSRSKAIHDAVREFIRNHRWMIRQKGEAAGAILATYDHEVHGITDELTDIEHSFIDIISASLHIHLDPKHCLEIIAVRGDWERIKSLAQSLQRLRGVLNVQVVSSY